MPRVSLEYSKRIADTTPIRQFIGRSCNEVMPEILDLAGYHCVELVYPAGESEKFDLSTKSYADGRVWRARKWCNEQFGEAYSTDGKRFWFDTDEQAVMFKLAWG